MSCVKQLCVLSSRHIERIYNNFFHTKWFIFLLSTAVLSEALAAWQMHKQIPQLVNMQNHDCSFIASLTNITSIRELLKPILIERIVSTKAHDDVAEYLQKKMVEYGFTTEWDNFIDKTPMGNKRFLNLIATFEPNVPRRLVLACHYDSKIIKNRIFLAATDSALPCALLLDIAKTLGPYLRNRINKEITLQLVFLDGEEAFEDWTDTDSIYGARHLAQLWERRWYPTTDGSAFELSKELDRIDVFMLLDLLGAANPKIRSSDGHGTKNLFDKLPEIENNLRQMGQLRPIPNIFYPGIVYGIEDDHIPFLKRGVPILHLIPVPFPKVWHTPDDNESVLHNDTIYNLASIIRVFVARYLGVVLQGSWT